MKNKIFETMDAAVADIPDGVTILSPGFSGVGVPRNLLAALNRQRMWTLAHWSKPAR